MSFNVGLWRDERRMGGLTCLRGTRIPADQMAEYIYDMRVDYGVTLAHLISLYHWDEAGRPEVEAESEEGET